jgi:hypothetical protein
LIRYKRKNESKYFQGTTCGKQDETAPEKHRLPSSTAPNGENVALNSSSVV